MRTRIGSLWITFNGEIFNYVELREELVQNGPPLRDPVRHRSHPPPVRGEGRGLRPATSTASGRSRSGMRRAAGCFCRAIAWACGRCSTRVARRPVRLSPPRSRRCSRIRRRRARASISKALDQIFTFWTPLAPRTMFRNIVELPPGHSLIVADGNIPASRATGSSTTRRATGRLGEREPQLRSGCSSCWSTRRASGCGPTCRWARI